MTFSDRCVLCMTLSARTLLHLCSIITVVCGLGHVLSSVILGFVGIGFGIALFKLEKIESVRGDLAMWLLLIFGFMYFVWGVFHAIKNKPHSHIHIHNGGELHSHEGIPHSVGSICGLCEILERHDGHGLQRREVHVRLEIDG